MNLTCPKCNIKLTHHHRYDGFIICSICYSKGDPLYYKDYYNQLDVNKYYYLDQLYIIYENVFNICAFILNEDEIFLYFFRGREKSFSTFKILKKKYPVLFNKCKKIMRLKSFG